MKPQRLVFPFLAVALLSSQPGAVPPAAGAKKSAAKDTVAQAGYRIDQPGTITFTVGMVIKGKIEKPQVLIFLPKEKTSFRELRFTHSFKGALQEPLPFSPLVE